MADGFLSRIGSDKPEPRKPTGPVVPPSDAYAAAALKGEVDKIESAPEGQRNHTLYSGACALFELVNAGALESQTVWASMTDAGRTAGLEELEIERTIRSAESKTDGVARMVPERPEKPSPVSSIGKNVEVPEKSVCQVDTDVWGTYPPIDAAKWIWEADNSAVELWGRGDDIAWASGEALTICGSQGIGKSTLAGQLVRAQLGLQDTVLDLPVIPIDKPILFLGMDRPAQLKRSLRRQFSEDERDAIAGRLLIRPGPPVTDMALDPTLLLRMAEAAGAGVVYVDSLKDAVVGLSGDEPAANYNRARQRLLAAGIELCELHHVRKPSADQAGGISSVYGSTWLTSGAGSVILLTGEPGDLVVRFRHAKTPANELGPWHLHLDPEKGSFAVQRCDLLASVRRAGADGLTAEAAAKDLYECGRPTSSEKKKAERQLRHLESKGLLHSIDGNHGPVWFLAENRLVGSELLGE